MKIFTRVSLILLLILFAAGSPYAMGQISFFDLLGSRNIGKAAPDFTLKTIAGKDVNMTRYRDGKKAIIFFWATWCPHCRVALRELNQDRLEIEKKNIKIILVDLGEEVPEVEAYAKKNKIDGDIFLDEDNSLATPYGLVGVPTFYFLSEDGIVRAIEHALPKNYEELLVKSKS